MRASRLLAIMIILKDKGRVTAQSLADRFEVSRRTIYRDLDELSAAGVPIKADRGVGGGIALAGDFTSDFTQLTPEEAAAFSLSGLPDLARRLGVASAAAGARAKIIDSLGSEAAILAERFHLDPSEWYHRLSTPVSLRPTAAAVFNNRKIKFDYESWSRKISHTVEPLGIVVKSGDWYLLGRKEKVFRIYRIAKMSNVTQTGTGFRAPAEFDLSTEWRKSVSRFEEGLFSETADIIVWPDAMARISRLGAGAAEAIAAAPQGDDASRRLTIPIEGYDAFIREALGFAGDIQIVGPPALRLRLTKTLKRLSRRLAE